MFNRRIEVDLVSLAAITLSYTLMMYGLVELAYAAGKSVGKIELRNELTREAITRSIIEAQPDEKKGENNG